MIQSIFNIDPILGARWVSTLLGVPPAALGADLTRP